MILIPCNQCRRSANCDYREGKRALLRGTKLTVARFSCPIMKDDYRLGRRVRVLLQCWDHHEDSEPVEAAFVGTVMQWVGRKLLVHLDTGESLDGFESRKPIVKVWPHYAEPLDEPDRQPCEVCNLPPGVVINNWHCGCQPGQSFGEAY